MARTVEWSEPAWDDLVAAADFIARDSSRYAAAFVQEIRLAAASFKDLADRGQAVPECSDETIRELLVRPYRLVYKILPSKVIVLALIHGAQRYRRF
jgi:plasmid stabilization system protein ParE